MWGFKFKTSGMAKTTLDGLKAITHTFHTPETFMTDVGSLLNNRDVCAWCTAQGTTHQVVPAYTPWINRFIENTNRKLLRWLKHLCIPSLREDNHEQVKLKDITKAWPNHFNTTIHQLNNVFTQLLQFFLKELLLGFSVNNTPNPPLLHNRILLTHHYNTHSICWPKTARQGKPNYLNEC